MRGLLLLVLGVGLALPFAEGAVVDAQNTGIIEGRIVNGTAGGPAIGSVPVSLLKFRRMTQEGEALGRTDAQGRFRFEGLEVDGDVRYFVQAGYEDVAYRSTVVDLNQGPGNVEVTVYETATTPDAVSIRRASIAVPQVDSSMGVIAVLEIVTFVNSADRTYVGNLFMDASNGGVLRIPLPEDAFDVNIGHGFGPEGVRPAPGGMISLTPLPPGEQELVYTYGIPYTETKTALRKLYAYPVKSVTVLVPASGPQVSAQNLETIGPVDISGTSNILMTGSGLKPGDVLTLNITGLPRFAAINRGGGPSLDTALRGTAVALLALVVIAAVAYARIIRRRRLAPAGVADLGELERERKSLVASLADLEEQKALGRVTEDEYERARRRQRGRLTDILLLLNEHSGEPVA